jgi:ectoine hydroxylase-related dioxygenase (phytanoyl-CoA dioxygenase family)
MSPIAVPDISETPTATIEIPQKTSESMKSPRIARYNANDPETTTELLVSVLERDGGVIVENLISQDLASRIRSELKPYFDTDRVDPSGFFPHTTQRATGLLARSSGCVELAMNKTYIDLANAMLSSEFTYWMGQQQETVTSKPIISSTVGFRVNPGGRQQDLHRDDSWVVLLGLMLETRLIFRRDYHTRNCDMPMMLGCVTALTRTTKDNGATICIPGSHTWTPERCPYDHEAIPAELEPGSALIFVGNLYHAGGGNITKSVFGRSRVRLD